MSPPRESRPGEEAALKDPAADQLQRNGFHLRDATEALGGSLKQWTVMSDATDPFRMDTPANHRDGEWLARTMLRLSITQRIHDRGIHYVISGKSITKPLGGVYKNNADDWEWLQGVISKARWLGYVDWDQIRDQRNDAPEVRMWTPPTPEPFVAVDFEVYLPSAEDLRPQARINGFTGTQPYHLVMVGEKSSLRDGLAPIADQHGADLYLPTGDISNTMVAIFTQSQCENVKVTRTPIPPGLKILQGRGNGRDSGGRLVPVPPNLERGLPDPPAWLPDEVRAMWEVIAPQVDELGPIKPQDGLVLAALCEIAATYAGAVVELYAQGRLLTNPKTGCVHKNPLVAVVETARRDLLRFAREFALTPLAETLLGKLPVPDDDEDDPFGAEGTYDH